MKNAFQSLTLVCMFVVGCQPVKSIPSTGSYEPGMGWFDRAMIRLMEKWDIPGGALAMIRDGEILLARGYGYANTETEELVQPDSIFRIASISKPITAVAVLKLVEDGRLDLDMSAFQILDDFQPPEGVEMDPRIDEITIRHLLEHTGGWDSSASPDPMFMAREIAEELGTPPPADCPNIMRYMLGQPLDFDPGSQYAYSNFGYCVLGRIVEKVSGQTYEEYVRTNILAPAGINGMHLGHSLSQDRYPREVQYYSTELDFTDSVFPEISEPVPWPYGGFYLEAMDAHGGWIASAVELVLFASALESTNPSAILNSNSLSLIFSRPESTQFAYGWKIRPVGKSAQWWSIGSIPGSSAILYRRSDGLIWAALFNTYPSTENDEFLVDVITTMGKAAVLDEILWGSLITLVVLTFVGVLFRNRRQKVVI